MCIRLCLARVCPMRRLLESALSGVAGVILIMCSEPLSPVRITFGPMFDGASIGCDQQAGQINPAMTDLRFYVHDVEVAGVSGNWVKVKLDPASPWQTDRVALLDLETGEGACHGGSPFIRSVVEGTAPVTDIAALRFTLGVPFDLNHADPVRADSPLNQSVMHWHWQGGYKFLRAGLATDDGSAWVHIGSTECRGTIGAIEGCNNPNRVIVTLDNFDPAVDTIAVNMDALFAGADFNGEKPSGCMAVASDPACPAILANLGLLPKTSSPPTGQNVFSHVAAQ